MIDPDDIAGPDGQTPSDEAVLAAADPSTALAQQQRKEVERQISPEAQLIRGTFRAAGFAVGTALRGTQWVAGTGLEVGRQIAQAAIEGETSAEIAERAANSLRSLAQTALGVTEGSVREIVSYVPAATLPPQVDPARKALEASTTDDLRRRGDALLAVSADVYFTEDVHPAFDRILGELAPDEARMLRFLALNGAQPLVDVRTNRPLGIGSELIAGDLTSVPEQAGVRHLHRSGSYVTNLKRLGLVEVSADPVVLNRYMVLEVQPSVEEARKKAGRAPKVIRKSLLLTDFGVDFCKTCFTLDPRQAESPLTD
ncbi:DUF4393 domain-containing protein [Aldersonia kunmingensis]|uniref:DUF4393 domain-containing protein n=1 Tax=Aldersonia kunmingensis TaxID=408066 RepID=UPI000AA690CB|nr:DUF4393 domain-containing protein [Aldersonia kunmingensis]